MSNNTREHILEEPMTEDMHTQEDIQKLTDLPEGRCKEMFEQTGEVYDSTNWRASKDYVGPAMMKYFAYEHLPGNLQSVSQPIAALADLMAKNLPDCAEKSAGLRKLLEAKDCFVRAALE